MIVPWPLPSRGSMLSHCFRDFNLLPYEIVYLFASIVHALRLFPTFAC
jgi:hypothetical protein